MHNRLLFVSHDRTFQRGLASRVLELGGESGTSRTPLVYPGSYTEYVQRLTRAAPYRAATVTERLPAIARNLAV